MDILLVIFVSLFIILISVWYSRHSKITLPGPRGFPFVGYIPFLAKDPHLVFQKLARKYGPIYKVRLGSRDVVVLCDFQTIKKALNDDAFVGRPDDSHLKMTETSRLCEAFTGFPCFEQRKFSMTALQQLGFGKTRSEENIEEEISKLLAVMEQKKQEAIILKHLLSSSVANNMISFLTYRTVSDNQIKEIVKAVNDVSQLLVAVSWQCFFPWIRAFISFFKLGNNGKIDQALNVVKNFMRQEIEHHKSTIDSNNPRDFIDKYLVQIKKNEDKKSSFKEDVLVDLGSVLIGTSTETVRVTLEWLLLTAAAFPDVQRKVQEEIEMVVGHERFPSWQDHVSMPYTEAAINELLRWKTIEPLIVLHYTLKDTRLNGYFIPKHMRVLPVLYAVDHSEELWGKDHDEYKPERMLSQDGKTVKKFEHLMPFLIGKRSCPGELMARIEIFRYFTAILQKFDLSMPVGKKADLHGIIGLTLQPPIQHICIKKRTS